MTTSAPARASIVVMGTGGFAVPAFRALLASRHRVSAVVTRPAHAPPGRRPPPNPMHDAAQAAGVAILAPERVNDGGQVAEIAALRPDLFFVCDYGQLLSAALLGVAPYGGLNLHGSLLPRHRGAAPVQWAILEGDAVSGVSVIHMTAALDAGNVVAARATPIGPTETAAALEARLAAIGAEAVLEAVETVLTAGPGAAVGRPQDPAGVTRAPRISKADGLIDWTQPADRIERMRRAFEPWPRTATYLIAGPGRPGLRIGLDDVAVLPGGAVEAGPPGSILAADAEGIVVACGGGTRLVIRRLVPEGKRGMAAADFLRGHPLFEAARLQSSA
jgi:methionyl-tRNA formyltransferase